MEIIKNFISRLFCSHDWLIIRYDEIPSPFDIVKENGYAPKTHCSLKRTYIWHYKCKKCRKIKRYKETTAQ
jgi:hypothetical protein